jgi:hypothetical protein
MASSPYAAPAPLLLRVLWFARDPDYTVPPWASQ